MVLGKRKRVFKNKRRTRPRRAPRRARRGYTIMRSMRAPLPEVLQTKLKYCQFISRTFSTAPDQYAIRMNGMYDPDYTGVGHQPYGFDELSTLYLSYVVKACKIVIANAPNGAIHMTIRPASTASDTSSGNDVLAAEAERPNCLTATICPASAGQSRFMKYYSKISKVAGKKITRNSEDYLGSYNSDPTIQPFYHIVQQNIDRATSTTNKMVVSVTYYCQWFKRRTYTQS